MPRTMLAAASPRIRVWTARGGNAEIGLQPLSALFLMDFCIHYIDIDTPTSHFIMLPTFHTPYVRRRGLICSLGLLYRQVDSFATIAIQ
jgi:hypothetical protein